ncbi:MAG: LptF/LptG family permease [Verrucomicrobiota bacterium]
MKILDRYLLRELLLPLGYCLGGFLIFWISFDLISEIHSFQKRHLLFKDILEYYVVTTPELLLLIMPIALLLALLYALTTHARCNELTAMRAAGISIWRLALPYFAVGAFFAMAYFVMNEWWVPGSIEKAEAIKDRYDNPSAKLPTAKIKQNLKFLNTRDNRAWWIKTYNIETTAMQGVVIDWYQNDGTRRVISAQDGIYENGEWKFRDVKQVYTKSAQDIFGSLVLTNALVFSDWAETPSLIKSEIKINNLSSKNAAKKAQLSLADIWNYRELHPRLDRKTRELIDTQFHGRIAAPFTCLVVVLIALPFCAVSARRNVYLGVASSLFICFVYYILLRLSLVLGIGGVLPGWLAAWLPNLVFSAASIWLTLRIR